VKASARWRSATRISGPYPWRRPFRDGAWAGLVVTGGHTLTRKPDHVGTATAGAAALTASTALMTVDALDLAPGDTVLVVGATGGIGGIAVPLARAAGTTVLAPGRPEDEEYLHALGASDVLPRGVASSPPCAGNTPAAWTRSSTP
jgi:NADPH2:quinone reductase